MVGSVAQADKVRNLCNVSVSLLLLSHLFDLIVSLFRANGESSNAVFARLSMRDFDVSLVISLFCSLAPLVAR